MKATTISIIIAGALIVGALVFSKDGNSKSVNRVINASNVSMVDGKQVIEIRAKGGYQPKKSIAKAGIPTIIRFNTDGTFDCSSSVRIPSMNISRSLPQSGTTDIDIGNPQVTTLDGTCGMGMYRFKIDFQS